VAISLAALAASEWLVRRRKVEAARA
jgi:hypothetical protein